MSLATSPTITKAGTSFLTPEFHLSIVRLQFLCQTVALGSVRRALLVSIYQVSLRPISLALPPTYWLEGMRRSLLGNLELHTVLPDWSNGWLALFLAASTAILAVLAHWFFHWSEPRLAAKLPATDHVLS